MEGAATGLDKNGVMGSDHWNDVYSHVDIFFLIKGCFNS